MIQNAFLFLYLKGANLIGYNNKHKFNMRDLDHSVQINFSRFNSLQWNQLNQEFSQDASHLHRPRESTNTFFLAMPNQPPRPGNNLYSCIESQDSGNSEIKQVPYATGESENKMIKHVNSKQYFRMMKRRIKKGMQKFLKGQGTQEKKQNKKYLHESRHKHALNRPRGKDGKFLATRPAQERNREKKKRGRKPKNKIIQEKQLANSPTKNEETPAKDHTE